MTSQLNLDAYFNRIQWGGSTRPSYDTLAQLVHAHMRHIPFENLDVLLGHPHRPGKPAEQARSRTPRRLLL